MNLYEIAEQYRYLAEFAEVISEEEKQNLLADLRDAIESKAENIGKLVLELEADDEAIQTEQRRLRSKLETIRNKRQWLKDYLLAQLQTSKIDRIPTALFTVRIATNPPSIELINQDLVPEQFLIQPPKVVDKAGILQHFKATGEIVTGVNIMTDKKRIDIR
jgi:hypothetical protein